jgi:hypothetical protein
MTRGRFAPGAPAIEATEAYGPLRFITYKAYTFFKAGPYHNFVFDSGGDAAVRPWVYWAGVSANLAFGFLLVAAVCVALWTLWRARSIHTWPMLLGASMFVLAFLALPPGRWVANTGERFLYPALLLGLLLLPLHQLALRTLAALALYFVVGLGGLASLKADWSVPVDPNWEAPGRMLFLHRPTTFLRQLEEGLHSEATGEAPRRPLAFETSVLLQVPLDPK